MKVQIPHWFTGRILFEGEFSNRKTCLEQGVKEGISFQGSGLRSADLIDADLSGADLSDANLRGVILRGANLIDADFSGACLTNTNLSDADLTNADLRAADLTNAKLIDADLTNANLTNTNFKGVKNKPEGLHTYMDDRYRLNAYNDVLFAGCTKKTFDEWLAYEGDELNEEDKQYLETITKPFIKRVMGD